MSNLLIVARNNLINAKMLFTKRIMNGPKQDYALPKLASPSIYRANVDYVRHGLLVFAFQTAVAFALIEVIDWRRLDLYHHRLLRLLPYPHPLSSFASAWYRLFL